MVGACPYGMVAATGDQKQGESAMSWGWDQATAWRRQREREAQAWDTPTG